MRTTELSVVNGFKFTFMALGKRSTFLQIDTCYHILRIENFYESITTKPYVIESIIFGMTPLSTSPIKLNGK